MLRKDARAETGRARQFEAIFSAAYPRVLGYAIRRTSDRAAAEDAVSETFLVAWRRLDDVPAEALPWLLGVARKVLANQRRAAGRRAAGRADPAGIHSAHAHHAALSHHLPTSGRAGHIDA